MLFCDDKTFYRRLKIIYWVCSLWLIIGTLLYPIFIPGTMFPGWFIINGPALLILIITLFHDDRLKYDN